MTKAERIRKLAVQHPEWSTKQIAAKCDCGDSYVRTALRQRVGGRQSEHDRRYRERFAKEHGLSHSGFRYRNDEKCRAYQRDWRARKKAERASAPA